MFLRPHLSCNVAKTTFGFQGVQRASRKKSVESESVSFSAQPRWHAFFIINGDAHLQEVRPLDLDLSTATSMFWRASTSPISTHFHAESNKLRALATDSCMQLKKGRKGTGSENNNELYIYCTCMCLALTIQREKRVSHKSGWGGKASATKDKGVGIQGTPRAVLLLFISWKSVR